LGCRIYSIQSASAVHLSVWVGTISLDMLLIYLSAP
jgi:hypothetical protein